MILGIVVLLKNIFQQYQVCSCAKLIEITKNISNESNQYIENIL